MMAASREALGEVESAAAPELFVHGVVTDEHDAVVVHLRVADAAGVDLGERRVRLEVRRCAAIEEPAALILAMMIAVARTREPAHELPRSAPIAPPVVPASSPGRDRPEPASPTRGPRTARAPMTVGASAVASVGALPNVGLGGAVRWTASLARVLLGLEGSFETSLPRRAASGETTFRLFDVGALAGVRIVRAQRFELVPLLEVRGGVLTGHASGFPSTYDAARLVGVVAAGALARIPFGSAFAVELLPDVRVPFAHDTFAVREGGKLIRVHSTASVEGRLSIGVGWSF